MKFRIWTILWVFALLASAMATFGNAGVLIGGAVIGFWAIFKSPIQPTVGELLIFPIGICLSLAFLIPAIQATRVATPRETCRHNMRAIALALSVYKDTHGAFPPPYSVDDQGNALHSWRVLILPYLEEKSLYQDINLHEPWDSEHNQQFWRSMPEVYRCPSFETASRVGAVESSPYATNYLAITDEQTTWPGGCTLSVPEAGSLYEPPRKLLLLEAATANECWMEPTDLSFEEAIGVLCGQEPGHLITVNDWLSFSSESHDTHYATIDTWVERTYRTEQSAARYLSRRTIGTEESESRAILNRKPLVLSQFVKWDLVYSFNCFAILTLLPLQSVRWKNHKLM